MGKIPKSVIHHDIPDILASLVAKIKMFGNVYLYSAGAHKSIEGHHVFYSHDPEHVGASFEYMLQVETVPNIYDMIWYDMRESHTSTKWYSKKEM